jgi:hypothetical protein
VKLVAKESNTRLDAQCLHTVLIRITCGCHRALIQSDVTLPLSIISIGHMHVIKTLHPVKVKKVILKMQTIQIFSLDAKYDKIK